MSGREVQAFGQEIAERLVHNAPGTVRAGEFTAQEASPRLQYSLLDLMGIAIGVISQPVGGDCLACHRETFHDWLVQTSPITPAVTLAHGLHVSPEARVVTDQAAWNSGNHGSGIARVCKIVEHVRGVHEVPLRCRCHSVYELLHVQRGYGLLECG